MNASRSKNMKKEVVSLGMDVIDEVLKTGTDLRHYSAEVEKDLKQCENKCIQDYISESKNIVSLHNQISVCDTVLERMESMLLGFQSDLGSISNEIVSLQRKSVSMSQQLNNRQAIRGHLSQFIEDIAVSDDLINEILDLPVTDSEFIKSLSTLSFKLSFVKEQRQKGVRSCRDVEDILEKLKIKAVEKTRTYMLEQVSKFKKPVANYQIPQNALLKHKSFYEFLMNNEKPAADEVLNEYIDTVSKVYFSYFKSYCASLLKLQFEETATKDDLLGIEESTSRSFFHVVSLKRRNTVFTIGNRGEVLTTQLEAPIIVPHSAHKNEKRYSYEALFRSEQYALLDNACREYLFICQVFLAEGANALNIFNLIMSRTLGLLLKNLENYVNNSYDLIALFLCAHIILRYQLLCHKRAVPALDNYWDSLQSIIWPRFEHVFRLNIQSVKMCDPNKFSKEMKPHYVTRRYAELSAALVSIGESFPNELVTKLLAQLLEEVECFILRMAAIFHHRKEQLIFLINNYDMAFNILMERTRENSKEADTFRTQLSSKSAEYVEEVLSFHFGAMIQYIKETEGLIEKGLIEDVKNQEAKQMALAKSFSSRWKLSLEQIHNEVILTFPNLVTGSSILQLTFTQLVQYYNRFNKLSTTSVKSHLPNIHVIMVEIKKYKTNF